MHIYTIYKQYTLIQTHTYTYIHMFVWVCIVCIWVYCLNYCVLYLFHEYVCIACILFVVYVLYVLFVLVCIRLYCMYSMYCVYCMYCMYLFVYMMTYIQIHTHTYIHTIQTKYRNDANVCMCMYFWLNTYIIHTACFTYIHIQTCRFPDAGYHKYENTWPAIRHNGIGIIFVYDGD